MKKKNLKNIAFQIDGIIINVGNPIKFIRKSFNGININGYNLKIPDKYKKEGFRDNDIYESILFSKTQFSNILNRIKQDNIEIVSLIGNNGVILNKEFEILKNANMT